MSFCYGVFSVFTDADQAVDELVTQGVREEDLNIIAHAKAILMPKAAVSQGKESKTEQEAFRSTETLSSLLSEQPEVQTTDAGKVVYTGRQAFEIVRRSSGLRTSHASLEEKLVEKLGMEAGESGRVCEAIRKGGIALWLACEGEMCGEFVSVVKRHNPLTFGSHER